MSGHTSGPWRECGHDRGGCECGLVWSETADMPVADTGLSGDEELRSMRPAAPARKANARLIAAAPELLGRHEADIEALEALAKAIHAGDPMPELVIRVTDMLVAKRAAIAKATGESA